MGISEATGGDGEPSHRDNVSFPCSKCNRETTWFVIPGNPGEGGMDFTVKMGSHGGVDDQTALIAFSQVPLGGTGGEWASEGPHRSDGCVSGDASGSVTLTTTTRIKAQRYSYLYLSKKIVR